MITMQKNMQKNFKILLRLGLLFFINSLNNLYAENLIDIYLLAKDNDPIVLGAKQAKLADSEGLIIARAKFLPAISITGTQNYVRSRDKLGLYKANDIGIYKANYNTNQYSLNINQPIFQIVNWMEYAKTKKQVLSSLKQYEDTEQTLLLRVAEQYFNILGATDQLATSQAATAAFSKRLEQAKQQFKVGITAITDVNEAQARLDNAKAKEISDSNTLNTAKEQMSQIIGKFIPNIASLKSQIPLLTPEPNNIDLWVDKARKNNLKLQAARYDVEAAYESIKASSSGHLPTINLSAAILNNKMTPPTNNKYHNKQLSLNLNIPIFAGGETAARTQAEIFRTNAILQQLETAYRAAESGTRIAYQTVLTQISQVNAFQQSVKSNKIALQATQAAFEVGTRTIIDVLNSQTDLLTAQKNYAQSRYDYLLSVLKLKQATGSLCLADLEQINNLLDHNNPSATEEPDNN